MLSNLPEKHQPAFAPANSGASKSKPFDPWIFWVTVRRCWPWAVPVGTLLACVVAILIRETFVPRYQAGHWLEASDDYLVFKGVMPTVRDLARTEKSIFFSHFVLDPVLADPTLRKAPSLADPAQAPINLRKNLSLQSGGTASRVVVTYEDTDPVAAAMVANAVTESYLRTREAFDSGRVDKLVRYLQPEVLRQQGIVQTKKADVERLSQSTLGFAPTKRLSVLEDQNHLSMFSYLKSQITELRVQLAVLDAQQKMDSEAFGMPPGLPEPKPIVTDLEPRTPLETEIRTAIERHPMVVEAKGRVEHYKDEVFQLDVTDRAKYDRGRYKDLQDQRDQAIVDLDLARKNARPLVVEMLEQLAIEDLEQRKREAEIQAAAFEQRRREGIAQEEVERQRAALKQRESLATQLEVLESEFAAEHARLEALGSESSKLQFAQEELELANETLQMLRARVASFETEKQLDGSVRTLSVAVPPKAPIETIPFKQMFVASTGAFLLPFLIGFLWEFRVQRVTDSKTVENANLLPVVGEVARLPAGSSSRKGRRLFEESIDTLRSNLFLSVDTKNTRSIAVVSSMSGEGKSSVASQLALSIAKATGETVLLVDTDLRCPDQHEIFGIESGSGLSAVLTGAATLDDAINTSLGQLIHVLPAGRLDRSPHRLMSPESMRQFVDSSLKRYAYVVFDTAPVLSAGETLALAAVVDSTLLCVMRDVSRIDNVTRTTRRLEASGARIAGTVFSGVSARQYSYRYGDYQYAVAADFVS